MCIRDRYRLERVGAVIGGHDDGNQLGHGRPVVNFRMMQALTDVARADKSLGQARLAMVTWPARPEAGRAGQVTIARRACPRDLSARATSVKACIIRKLTTGRP